MERPSEGWLPTAAQEARSWGGPHLPCEFVATLDALKLPHSLVPANVDTQLFYRWERKREPVGSSSVSYRLTAMPANPPTGRRQLLQSPTRAGATTLPLKVFPQMWQKWGRPSWCRLATCLSSGPFSVKRCSQNSQLNGRSPV